MIDDTITLEKVNEVYIRINCSSDQATELRDYLSCYMTNYFFHPLFKSHKWDGKISFFNIKDKLLPIGLLIYFFNWIKQQKYEYKFLFDPIEMFNDVDRDDLLKFLNVIFKKSAFFPRDYQQEQIYTAIEKKRGCIISSTGTGKSLVIASIIEFLLSQNKNILIVVPNILLVNQLKNDIADYGLACGNEINILYSGKEYSEEKKILISTWQSIFRKDTPFFKRFDALIVDECLHPESMISMKDNTFKRISDVRLGDEVKTFNEINNKYEYKPIHEVYMNLSRTRNNMYEIELDSGQSIKITGNHFVKSVDTLKWKRVDELKVGERIFNESL